MEWLPVVLLVSLSRPVKHVGSAELALQDRSGLDGYAEFKSDPNYIPFPHLWAKNVPATAAQPNQNEGAFSPTCKGELIVSCTRSSRVTLCFGNAVL